jgi:hypothetical protein
VLLHGKVEMIWTEGNMCHVTAGSSIQGICSLTLIGTENGHLSIYSSVEQPWKAMSIAIRWSTPQ